MDNVLDGQMKLTFEEEKNKFLLGQLLLYRKIKDGEDTWDSLNEYRASYGYPPMTIDSLRRQFQQFGVYDEAGWITPNDTRISTPIIDKEQTMVNYETGETTSVKVLALDSEQLRNPDALLMAHGFDPDCWTIKTANNTKSNRVTVSGADVQYYSSRVLVKPKENNYSDIKKITSWILDNYKSDIDVNIQQTLDFGDSLVIPLYDFHWGRLPQEEEYAGFDMNNEKRRIVNHVRGYIEKFNGKQFKEIYLIVGQDFLNSSFTGYTSSQSHLQSNSMDFYTMFKSGSELLIDIINLFRGMNCPVKVVGSLGNHDTAEEYCMFMLLQAYYRNNPEVVVDCGSAPRKYFKIGNACVGFGHLDKEKDRIYGLMQTEAKAMFADTKSHMFIAGHLHHFEVTSKSGVELWRIPTICYQDRWTVENGYTQNDPRTMCFIFNDKDGLVESHFMYL